MDVEPQNYSMTTSYIDVEDVRELQSAQKIGQDFSLKFVNQVKILLFYKIFLICFEFKLNKCY